MKTSSLLINSTLFLLLTFVFIGCKKGEDDPFVSLRSRKARVTGSFETTGLEYKFQDSSFIFTASLVDGKLRFTESEDGQVNSGTVPYSSRYLFEKDGKYSIRTITGDDTAAIEGSWAFLGKNGEQDLKNKEALVLTETSITTGSGNLFFSTITTNGRTSDVFRLLQLKEKEIVMTQKYEGIYDQIKFEKTITLQKMKE
ncbi:MAG: hypothetical protein KJ941_07475 [Bacteroidetes bacterium]|nr:hypothetical protein [Bacteroidota bacterium]